MEKWIFVSILLGSLALYLTQRVPIIITALATLVALIFTGLMPVNEAFSGFSNPATITVASMFVLSAGLIRTGALEPLTQRLLTWSKGSPIRLILGIALIVPLISAFINNTPVVVMMVPVVLTMARTMNTPPSKLLIPLSFFSILGGTCTLIGTSTNLLIDEIYHHSTGVHLGMFSFLKLGLPFLVAGSLYLIFLGPKLLPNRDSLSALLPSSRRSQYVTEVIIAENSQLIGKCLVDRQPGGDFRLLQLLRGNDEHYFARDGEKVPLRGGDVLILEASPQELTNLLATQQVNLGTVVEDMERVPIRTFPLMVVEMVVLPESPYIGTRVKDLKLYQRFGVKVMAIQRGGRHHMIDLRQMRIKAGDLFLVQGEPMGLHGLGEVGQVLIIEDLAGTLRKTHKATTAIVIMAAVVLLTMVTSYPLVVWALLGAIALILTECLDVEEAIDSLDFSVLFLLIGTIPLGTAMVRTGLIDDLAGLLTRGLGDHPMLMVAGLYLVTNILTAILSNNAVAVLMAPLALTLAKQWGLPPEALIMTVAFAANFSLATPQGYQTNIIVMGPGGYLFRDYIKIGLPLSLMLWVLASVLIPLIWF